MQFGADDGLMDLAELVEGERRGEEAVRVGVDVDVAVAELVPLAE